MRIFIAGFSFLLAFPLYSAVVTTCDDISLRTAVAGGGLVTMACDGVISLTNTITATAPTTIDANGRQITITGGGSHQIFRVPAGVRLELRNLTIADGRGTKGGAILSAGVLVANDCTFRSNSAIGLTGITGTNGPNGTDSIPGPLTPGSPGGSGTAGGSALGGAIYAEGGAFLTNCLFVGNTASGGTGGIGGNGGRGGGLCGPRPGCGGSNGGANGGAGGSGGTGGEANGGAIYGAGPLIVFGCRFETTR